MFTCVLFIKGAVRKGFLIQVLFISRQECALQAQGGFGRWASFLLSSQTGCVAITRTSCLLLFPAVFVRGPLCFFKLRHKWGLLLTLVFIRTSPLPYRGEKIQIIETLSQQLTLFESILLIIFCFMSMSILTSCMYMYHMHAWWPIRSEKGVGSPKTGVTDSSKLP